MRDSERRKPDCVRLRERFIPSTIIPYTHDNTNFHRIEKGTRVNIEFDIIGKYLARLNNY